MSLMKKLPILALAFIALAACSKSSTNPPPLDGGNPRFTKPAGHIAVSFKVDATANKDNNRAGYQHYTDGQLQWKGSFLYDEATNVLTKDVSWAGEVGPYPLLYDDGPIASGGHETADGVAGDGIFSVEVYVKPDASADTTYEYGLTNEFGYWIWEGPNGTFNVPANGTQDVTGGQFKITSFGPHDMKVLIDVNHMHPDYEGFNTATDRVFLKGSMNSWTPVQLLDNGLKGDTTAGDGIYTYIHKENMGIHDGLLQMDQHVQFVFVFCYGETCTGRTGIEYKIMGNAVDTGVTAFSNASGNWAEEDIILEMESRGRAKNTTIIIGRGKTGEEAPQILLVEPGRGPTAGNTPITITGSNFRTGATVTFGGITATEVNVASAGTITCKTPAHAEGSVDVVVRNSDNTFGTYPRGYRYADGQQQSVIGWAQLMTTTMTVTKNQTSGELKGQVWVEGVTDGTGRGATVIAKIGYGPNASNPSVDESGWSWFAATYKEDAGNNDVYAGMLTIPTAGTYSFCYKFSVDGGTSWTYADGDTQGSTNGYQPASSGTITVKEPSQPEVGWATLMEPLTQTVSVGETTATLYARVWADGVTNTAGQGADLTAELGYGPDNAEPATWPGANWKAATYDRDQSNDDVYKGVLTVNTEGSYDYCFRFKMTGESNWTYADNNGTGDGYTPANAGTLNVNQAGGNTPRITQLNPAFGQVAGGEEITLTGTNLGGATMKLDGQAVTVKSINSPTNTELKFDTPAHAASDISITVTTTEGSASKTFTYVLKGTPVVDGTIGEGATDWHAHHKVAEFTPSSCPAFTDAWGADNILRKLYVAYDDTRLYIGLKGSIQNQTGNAFLIYIDRDYGASTGVVDMDAGGDDSGKLDNTLSSVAYVQAPGFGAEFALGARRSETDPWAIGEVTDGTSDLVGWRDIVSNPADFHWKSGTVKAGSEYLEASITWTEFGGKPTGKMALFVRMGSWNGDSLANQTLPVDNCGNTPQIVQQVVTFDVK